MPSRTDQPNCARSGSRITQRAILRANQIAAAASANTSLNLDPPQILNYEIAGTRSLLTKTAQQLERQPGDEVVVVIFLAGYKQQTIPRQMWAGIREQISPTILAVATILVLFSIALLTTVELLRRRSSRLRGLGG